MVGSEGLNPPLTRSIAMRERILKWMPFDARLKLLIAIVGEPDRVPRKEHRREGDIEGEGV